MRYSTHSEVARGTRNLAFFTNFVWPFNAQVSTLLQEFLDFLWTRIPLGGIKAKRKGESHIKVLWIEQKHIPSTEIRVKTGKGKGIFLGVFQGEHFNSCYRVWSLILIFVWQRSWKVLKKKQQTAHVLGINLDLWRTALTHLFFIC